MSVKMRQEVERKIIHQVVDSLLEAGFSISIDNGDNNGNVYELEASRSRRAIRAALYQTDDERIYAIDAKGRTFGWVYFVYGNDGWDVISDYTVNLEKFIGAGTATQKIVDHYAD
jgi:hypothetical protein